MTKKTINLKNLKTKNYPSNEDRTKDWVQNFGRDGVLRQLISSTKPIIFDVGAHNGKSIVQFKELFPNSIIYSFEPNPDVFTALQEVADAFENVNVVNTAITNKVGPVVYFQQGINSGLGGLHKRNISSKDSIDLNRFQNTKNDELNQYLTEVNKSEINVPGITLKSFADNNLIEMIDLIKIDTQGHEPEVLEGSGDLLKRVKVILAEISFYDFYERSVQFYDVEKHINKYGFKLYDISHISKNPMNGRTDWVDVIYAK